MTLASPDPPKNPVDGQVWVKPTDNGYWQFAYRLADSSWYFVGGNPPPPTNLIVKERA